VCRVERRRWRRHGETRRRGFGSLSRLPRRQGRVTKQRSCGDSAGPSSVGQAGTG
jgi:hypothetical protein